VLNEAIAPQATSKSQSFSPALPFQFHRKKRVDAAITSRHNNQVNDYERIGRVIRYLDEHHNEQPSLAMLAQQTGLSQFHFHRLFSSWAGITPKDFLQCLTVAHAKQLLRKGESILDASLQAGLSSPGRLHDLCVTLEAASPGELKFGGEGWTIAGGFAETPFGTALIAEGPRGICHLSFNEPSGQKTALVELRNAWPAAKFQRDDSAAARNAARIFESSSPRGSRPALRAFVRGTSFQLRVWRALLQVQPGMLVTYGRLAAAIGQPTAARAVGSAVGSNPVAYLIPCHRVIRETGVLGEYRWDPIRKRAMLAWESAPRPSHHSERRFPINAATHPHPS
jgi:AraC family transcriptional regulator of adaptative response/methylated-DNA-[protein]-cysteine methyltransferase